MPIPVIQGWLTNVTQRTETVAKAGRFNVWSFRLGDRHAAFSKSKADVRLADGVLVTAAGEDAKETFRVYALRNDTTGPMRKAPVMGLFVLGGFVTALAASMLAMPMMTCIQTRSMLLLLGVLTASYGIYVLSRGMKLRAANLALVGAPVRNAAGEERP